MVNDSRANGTRAKSLALDAIVHRLILAGVVGGESKQGRQRYNGIGIYELAMKSTSEWSDS